VKAMKEAEQGWQRAIDKIAERAGLTKSPDGAWRMQTSAQLGHIASRRSIAYTNRSM